MSLEIDVLTIFPELVRVPLSESIMGRASDKGHVTTRVHDLREWTTDNHKKVDDEPLVPKSEYPGFRFCIR